MRPCVTSSESPGPSCRIAQLKQAIGVRVACPAGLRAAAPASRHMTRGRKNRGQILLSGRHAAQDRQEVRHFYALCQFLSPGGASGFSRGREPPDRPKTTQAPAGRQELSGAGVRSCRPFGASAQLALPAGGSRPRPNPPGPVGADDSVTARSTTSRCVRWHERRLKPAQGIFLSGAHQ